MNFYDLPQEAIAEVNRCRDEARRELQERIDALMASDLEAFGMMRFEVGHRLWREALALAALRFGTTHGLDFIDLRWDPFKYQGAWKISTNGWEGYVDTAQVCLVFGWKSPK
jgi:hypothetical protein